jgi:UDP-N-acetylmuramyl tripeptide synthase
MHVRVTVAAAKLAGALSRISGRGSGDALPGVVAERLDPGLAAKLVAGLPHGVILVTGTNGKTTTTKLLADMLTAAGERVVSNRTGSNLKRGIVAALVRASDGGGRLKDAPTVGLFEVDEANLRLVAPLLEPRHIVVTNLFRDQLDRYGELDTTAAKIGEGIRGTSARLYLNADDPLVTSLARYAAPDRVTYFGIDAPMKRDTSLAPADSDHCPVCGAKLTYEQVFYSHLGHYHCPNNDFARPKPEIAATDIAKGDAEGSDFVLGTGESELPARLPLGGLYNLYNSLAATAVASDGFGISNETIHSAMISAGAAFGRVEHVDWDGRRVVLLLIKNPTGFTQVIDTFLRAVSRPNILIVINDLAADGRDVSWLWDVSVDVLVASNPNVAVAGIRATDMALRLKYAGIEARVMDSIPAGLDWLHGVVDQGETGYVLPTYTAMLEVRRELAKRTTLKEAGL